MKQAIKQMLSAYDRFFKQHNSFPKFKTKKDKQSALFPYDAISKRNTFETRHISLIKSLKILNFVVQIYILKDYKSIIRI